MRVFGSHVFSRYLLRAAFTFGSIGGVMSGTVFGSGGGVRVSGSRVYVGCGGFFSY